MHGLTSSDSDKSDTDLHRLSKEMKPVKTATEIRDAIKTEAGGVLGWPTGRT